LSCWWSRGDPEHSCVQGWKKVPGLRSLSLLPRRFKDPRPRPAGIKGQEDRPAVGQPETSC
jgi:hypothetical protein